MIVKPIAWLLVGGSHHGEVVNITQGTCAVAGDDRTLYHGQNYNTNGRLYRIGVCSKATSNDRAGIDILIAEKQLRPIAGG